MSELNFNLVPRVSLTPFPWSEIEDWKKRDPGNEVDSTFPFCLIFCQLVASCQLGLFIQSFCTLNMKKTPGGVNAGCIG